MEGRCMRCKGPKEMKNVKIEQTPKGTYKATGNCSVCDCGMCKFLKKEDAEKMKNEANQ